MYDVLRGRLQENIVVLFKIRDCSQVTMRWLPGIQILSPVNSGGPSDIHSLVTVQLREDAREFTLVDIRTILGLAYLIPEGDRPWVVNSCITLRTLNEIYK